jgi:hypothetical protein
MTPEKFYKWLDGGRIDTSIISEYVGAMYIGYNTFYSFSIDVSNARVTNMVEQMKTGLPIPEITKEEKQNAIALALTDPLLSQILAEKSFTIPSENVGVWHSTPEEGNGALVKLGIVVMIDFDQEYTFVANLPAYIPDEKSAFSYSVESRPFAGTATSLHVLIGLDNSILDISVMNEGASK